MFRVRDNRPIGDQREEETRERDSQAHAQREDTHDERSRQRSRRVMSDGAQNSERAQLPDTPAAHADRQGRREHDHQHGAGDLESRGLETQSQQYRDIAAEHEAMGQNGQQTDRPEPRDVSTHRGDYPHGGTTSIRDRAGDKSDQRHCGDQREEERTALCDLETEVRQEKPCRAQTRDGERTGGDHTLEERSDDRYANRHAGGCQGACPPDTLPDEIEDEQVSYQANAERTVQPPPGRHIAEPVEHDAKPRHCDEQIAQKKQDGKRKVVRLGTAKHPADRSDIDRMKCQSEAHRGSYGDRHGPHLASTPRAAGPARMTGVHGTTKSSRSIRIFRASARPRRSGPLLR